MAHVPLNYAQPNLYIGYSDPTTSYCLERDKIFLLIEEVIDYSLRHHNLLNWIPPVNLNYARSLDGITLFNENFASIVITPDTEQKALCLAYGCGFNVYRWLAFTNNEAAIRYLKHFIRCIYNYTSPLLHQMFAFSCYASRVAYQDNNLILINAVVWAHLAVFREVLSLEEYYSHSRYQLYYVDNIHNNQHGNNQPRDVDEGIGDKEQYSSGYKLNPPLFYADMILLFVEELIHHSLRYNDLNHWIPPISIETLQRTENSYFTENIGRAVADLTDAAVYEAEIQGFDEIKWLNMCVPSEARNFQCYFFEKLLDLGMFLVFSFACHSSNLAMKEEKNSLVNEVTAALVCFLRQYYPHEQHYKELDTEAIQYFDERRYSESIDDGVHSVDHNEENNEEAPSHSDGEQNEPDNGAEASSHSDGEQSEAYNEAETPTHSDGEQNEAYNEANTPSHSDDGEQSEADNKAEAPSDSDGDQNETDESYSEFSLVRNEAKDSGSNTTKEISKSFL